MASKKLICYLMSLHYYTGTKGKECPECRLLARIIGFFQPAPDNQTEYLKDTLAVYAKHRSSADVMSPAKEHDKLRFMSVKDAQALAAELGRVRNK